MRPSDAAFWRGLLPAPAVLRCVARCADVAACRLAAQTTALKMWQLEVKKCNQMVIGGQDCPLPGHVSTPLHADKRP